jgi:hypothetical protein
MTVDQLVLVSEALWHAYELERVISQAPILQLQQYIRVIAIIARLEQLAADEGK